MSLFLLYAFVSTGFSVGYIQYEQALLVDPTMGYVYMVESIGNQIFLISIFLGFFQANGSLFYFKDFDLLGSLPLTAFTILSAKFFVMFAFSLIFMTILLTPYIVVYVYFAQPRIITTLLLIMSFLTVPIPGLLIGSLASFLVVKVTEKWLNPKVLQTMLSMTIIIGFVIFSLLETFSLLGEVTLARGIEYPFLAWLILLASDSLVYALFLLIVHGMIWYLFMLVLKQAMLKLNQSKSQVRYKKINQPYKAKKVPLFQQLLQLEWARFITITIYAFNTSFGVIMLAIATILLPFLPGLLPPELLEAIDRESIILIMIATGGFVIALTHTPAVSLSLEGKKINLLKSMPLRSAHIVLSKIGFNVLLLAPVIILFWVIGSIVFSLMFVEAMLALLLTLLLVILFSSVFMWINLWFPRFDFVNEVEVVKQSIAPLVAVLGGLALFVTIGYGLFQLLSISNLILTLSTGIVGLLLLIFLSLGLMLKHIELIFYRLTP